MNPKFPLLPEPIYEEWLRVSNQRAQMVVAFMSRWPSFQKNVALMALTEAIAICDTLGVNVQEHVTMLRSVEARKKEEVS
jgi:hypothetical protein